MKMVRCKVDFTIEGRDKLLVANLDSLIKHSSVTKCSVVKPRMAIDAYYVNPNNAHVKNEKLYASKKRDIVTNIIEKAE
jgi:hypothetical protein